MRGKTTGTDPPTMEPIGMNFWYPAPGTIAIDTAALWAWLTALWMIQTAGVGR